MNTKQLVAIWYTGLAIDFFILGNTQDLWAIIVSILIIGALFVITFSPHEKVNKKRLLIWVISPVVLVALVYLVYELGEVVVYEYHENKVPISPRKIVPFELYDSFSEFPSEEKEKVEGKASINANGYLTVSLYNGSSWNIKTVQVALTIIKANGEKSDERIYNLTRYSLSIDGEPYKTTEYRTQLGYTLSPGEKFNWYIKSLKGYKY